MSSRKEVIAANLQSYEQALAGKARLLAVSKTYPAEDVQLAYLQGQRDFGENKVQELKDKSTFLKETCPDLRWHFIGKLQSNKLNMLLACPGLVSIHSIDSIKLLNKLLSKKPDTKIGLFLQYNTSQEEQKGGFESYADLKLAARSIAEGEGFYLQGLMTIGSIRADDFEAAARRSFAQLRDLKRQLCEETGLKGLELSMGMTQDFQIALEYEADWIRVGTGIFGARG